MGTGGSKLGAPGQSIYQFILLTLVHYTASPDCRGENPEIVGAENEGPVCRMTQKHTVMVSLSYYRKFFMKFIGESPGTNTRCREKVANWQLSFA